MPRRFPRGHKATKDLIAQCAKDGVAIDYIPDAPRFRFTPVEIEQHPYNGREHRPPSGRGTVACGGNPLKLKNWTPSRLSLDPMYGQPMTGDDWELHTAKAEWARGNPEPLREYLQRQAESRRQCQQREKEREAA